VTVSAATGEVTVSVNPPTDTTLGGVLSAQCANATDKVIGINQSGNIVCATDDDTTYAVIVDGGLELTNDEFGIADGGVTSAHILDDTVELADLSPAARAAVVTELVLNRNPGFEEGLVYWVEDGSSTQSPALIDAGAQPTNVFAGQNSLSFSSPADVDISLAGTNEMYPVLGSTLLTLRFYSKRVPRPSTRTFRPATSVLKTPTGSCPTAPPGTPTYDLPDPLGHHRQRYRRPGRQRALQVHAARPVRHQQHRALGSQYRYPVLWLPGALPDDHAVLLIAPTSEPTKGSAFAGPFAVSKRAYRSSASS